MQYVTSEYYLPPGALHAPAKEISDAKNYFEVNPSEKVRREIF
jgi:hypothetical protein